MLGLKYYLVGRHTGWSSSWSIYCPVLHESTYRSDKIIGIQSIKWAVDFATSKVDLHATLDRVEKNDRNTISSFNKTLPRAYTRIDYIF